MLSKRRMLMCAPLALVALGAVQAKAKERVIKIEARKFRYAPNVIELKKGEAVVLELTALDFPHGFSLPDFKIRADLVIGKPVRVKLKPEEAGQFGFLCDNFCGSGHEEMSGTLIVKA
ncbi:cytochrome-c oxidase [Duganella rhizosphaerae]|uniref:cupredoxin domain-containing protein n=1 Tax=Duganella rhizosphaerae TaxID=2885763 RepID=UPI0030E8E022